jgi:hypothetical protein
MAHQRHRSPDTRPDSDPRRDAERLVSEEWLVLRNYDADAAHEVTVRLYGPRDDLLATRTETVGPAETLVVASRVHRGVYRVRVDLDGYARDDAECLLGSGPNETALVEVGNGLVSVTDGLLGGGSTGR